MIRGIGVDIVYLPRIQQLITKYTYKRSTMMNIASKVMCFQEQEHFKSLLNQISHHNDSTTLTQQCVRYMAGIWATKESTYKAISSFIPPNEMIPAQTIYSQLLYKSNSRITGSPQVDIMIDWLSARPEYETFYNKYIKGCKILLSISHDGDYLIAYTTIIS